MNQNNTLDAAVLKCIQDERVNIPRTDGRRRCIPLTWIPSARVGSGCRLAGSYACSVILLLAAQEIVTQTVKINVYPKKSH